MAEDGGGGGGGGAAVAFSLASRRPASSASVAPPGCRTTDYRFDVGAGQLESGQPSQSVVRRSRRRDAHQPTGKSVFYGSLSL